MGGQHENGLKKKKMKEVHEGVKWIHHLSQDYYELL